jgi:hypothetical protein
MKAHGMYIVLDVETKNLGSDIMRDSEQLLSLQLGDATKQKLYYYDSKNPKLTLEIGKKQITILLSQGAVFAGYNIKGFDAVMLKEFLGIEIPETNMLDLCLCQQQKLTQLTGRNKPRLEEACAACGVEATHKRRMNERAKSYKSIEAHKNNALARAKELVEKRGWSQDFSYNYALDKIAGGHAIWDAYLEFAESGGRNDTLFYEYAIGDVISEHQLLRKLGY